MVERLDVMIVCCLLSLFVHRNAVFVHRCLYIVVCTSLFVHRCLYIVVCTSQCGVSLSRERADVRTLSSGLQKPVMNSKYHRRSKSADVWLEHIPVGTVPTGTESYSPPMIRAWTGKRVVLVLVYRNIMLS